MFNDLTLLTMAFCFRRPETAFSADPSDKKQKRIADPKHLDFIRKLPSAVSCRYGCEACHIRSGSAVHKKKRTGAAQKPDDAWTIPLTPEEHKAQHSMNELEFWKLHGIDPFEVANQLYQVSGDLEAGRSIIGKARK